MLQILVVSRRGSNAICEISTIPHLVFIKFGYEILPINIVESLNWFGIEIPFSSTHLLEFVCIFGLSFSTTMPPLASNKKNTCEGVKIPDVQIPTDCMYGTCASKTLRSFCDAAFSRRLVA